MTIASTLKDAMVTVRGKTVTEVARELKISRPALSNVLNGHAELSIPLAFRIQKKFGFQVRLMLGDQLDEQIAAYKKAKRLP